MSDGDLPLGIADRQIAAAQRGALARLDARGADPGRRLVAGDLRQFQRSSCLLFDCASVAVLARALFLGDELLQVPPLGQDGGVRALLVLAFLVLEFQEGIDLAGKRSSTCRATGRACGRRWRRETPGRARRSGRPRDGFAGSAPAESACAGRESSSVRRAAAGSARAAAGPPASRASASRRRAWRWGRSR